MKITNLNHYVKSQLKENYSSGIVGKKKIFDSILTIQYNLQLGLVYGSSKAILGSI